MMNKMLVFDMDGTIADLYGVMGWLDMLRAEDETPYKIAEPLCDMERLVALLKLFQMEGWTIVVTSWLAKESSKTYDEKVRAAKREWLERYNFPYDEIHLVQYGTTKANCTRKKSDFQILIDDNENVRRGWNLGPTIDANKDIIKELKYILVKY